MNSQDLVIDDILVPPEKKKIKSGQKGKRGERDLVKIFNSRFIHIINANPDGGGFSRSIGSGNRWGQNVILSNQAQNVFSGDLVTPPTFKFVIESKNGYNDIDLCTVFEGQQAELDSFLQQVGDDAERTNRKPMLIWKKDRKPRLTFVREDDIISVEPDFVCTLHYKGWIAVLFEELLKFPDAFFFDQ